MPSTAAKDRRRERAMCPRPDWAAGVTCQIRLSEAWSWLNALVDPNSRITSPTMVARGPSPSRLALITIDWMAIAPSSPTRPRICSTISPLAASGPKSAPATAITMTSTGARENTV